MWLVKGHNMKKIIPINEFMYLYVSVSRDELTSERDIESTYYLYEKGGMLFGHYTEGTWYFGLKVDT